MENRAQRVLLAAFVLSLLVHALIALIVRTRFVPPPEGPQVITILRRPHVLRITHMIPTPRPSVRPATVVTKTPPLAPKSLPKIHGENAPGTAAPIVAVAPTPRPTPVPSAPEPCTDPNAPATLAASPPPADIPSSVRADATSGIVDVRVSLDARADVTDASVTQSSGNPSLDLVAATMARDAQYSPAYQACKPVPGQYIFVAKFIAW